jgi:hypothetical protein
MTRGSFLCRLLPILPGRVQVGRSAKALLQFACLCSVFGAVVTCGLFRTDEIGWTIRFVFIAGAMAAAGLLCWAALRRDRAPDMLAPITRSYLESDGLCFIFTADVFENFCRLNVYFQNRYSRRCRCEIFLDPPKRFWFGRLPLAPARFEIDCGGGECGIARVCYPVPPESQGQAVSFEVAARTKYAQGRGQLLRYREGLRVGPRQGGASAIVSLAAACVGVLYLSRSARAILQLPVGVASSVDSVNSQASLEIIWRPAPGSCEMSGSELHRTAA